MFRVIAGSDRGSMAPFGIGLFMVSLSLLLTTVCASSLFIFQKRLTNLSESAALYVAATGEGSPSFLALIGDSGFKNLKISDQLGEDRLTVTVATCATWVAPIIRVGQLTSAEICSRASARSD